MKNNELDKKNFNSHIYDYDIKKLDECYDEFHESYDKLCKGLRNFAYKINSLKNNLSVEDIEDLGDYYNSVVSLDWYYYIDSDNSELNQSIDTLLNSILNLSKKRGKFKYVQKR